MSEQIKYECVTGRQDLFSGAPQDATVAVKHDGGISFYPKENSAAIILYTSKCIELAMRRIIKTPVWTKADQEAGRLPEVGCIVLGCLDHECKVIGIDEKQEVVAIQYGSKSMDIVNLDEIYPIETPEERANRLKKEWVESVRDITPVNEDVNMFMLSVQQNQTQLIYDALLSGELKMPEVQK